MFGMNDRIVVEGYGVGRIVNWYFDEGNVWIVRLEDGTEVECCDSELVMAY